MRHLLYILVLSLVVAQTAQAQTPLDQVPITPAGVNGEYTLGQGGVIALRTVPGTILGTSARKDEDRFYHQYRVLTKDGSIYVVEVNAASGKVRKIYIDFLSDTPTIPFDIISTEAAQAYALEHVINKIKGVRKPKARSVVLSVKNQNPVYIVAVKKLVRIYDVVVDARDGRVISMKEQ